MKLFIKYFCIAAAVVAFTTPAISTNANAGDCNPFVWSCNNGGY